MPLSLQSRLAIATTALAAVVAASCGSDPAIKKQKYLESGNGYFEKQQYTEAIIEYRNAIAIDAKFGPARKRLGEAYAKIGNAPGARDEYVRAADLLPNDVEVQLDAGQLLLAFHKPQDALGRAEAALKLDPRNVQAHVLRASALIGLNSFDEALNTMNGAIDLDPNRARTFSSLGDLQLARGRREEAEAAFRKAAEMAPNDLQVHLALGNFYSVIARPREAEQAFLKALTIEPQNKPANRFLASLMIATGRRADAEPYLQRIADSKDLPSVVALADYYLTMRRPKDAISSLERIENANSNPLVAVRLARAYVAADDKSSAQALVDQVLTQNPKDADAQLLKGQMLLDAGKRDEAFQAVQAASTANPSSVDAQFALGRMYAERGDNAAAQAAFKEVLRLDPRAAGAQIQLARLQAKAGNRSESLRTAEEVARNNPKSLAARLELVRSLLAVKDFAQAQSGIAKLHTDFPDAAAVYVQESRLALLKNDLAGARAALNRAQTLEPKSIDVFESLIALDFKQNNPSGAKSRVEDRLAQERTPQVLLIAARTSLSIKDVEAAEKMLRELIQLAPSVSESYGLLGSIYLGQKKLDQAVTEFESLAKLQTKPVGPLTMVGMILERQGKRDLARKKYEDVLAIDPRAATASNNLAWLLADIGEDLDRAVQLAQAAVAASPETPEIIDTLGWVYYKKNQPELAIAQFLRCVQKAPTVADYHYHLGLAYLQSGDAAKGRVSLLRALSAQPNATVAAEARRLLAAS